VCVCVRACTFVCVCELMCARVCACVRECVRIYHLHVLVCHINELQHLYACVCTFHCAFSFMSGVCTGIHVRVNARLNLNT